MIRRLFWDIETSPNLVLAWRAGYNLDISHDSIVKERAIITIAYKWEGDKTVHALTWDKSQNDRAMLLEFLGVANESDEMVAHFGDNYDLPWFRARCLFHGITTFPTYKTIDTKKWASKHFYFNSNKLDYIAKFLGLEGKIKVDFDLWKRIVLHKDRKSLDEMVRYNKRDVVELEKVWGFMHLAVPHETHAGVLEGHDKWSCPHCASEAVSKSKTRVTAAGTIKHQMQCGSCHGYFSIPESTFKRYNDRPKK